MPDPTQDDRVGALATPLGKDVLLLGRFDGVEGLSELFEYRIEALSQRENINFNDLIGLNLSVHLKTVDDVGRDFSGVLVEARWMGKKGTLYIYRLVLRPWLWLLSRTSNCRIFETKTVTKIIEDIFTLNNFSDYSIRTTANYPTLEYCVQYRETDLNFVCRLMEENGIYYFFEYEQGDGSNPTKHTLVLVDSKATHQPVTGLSSVSYSPSAGVVRRDKQQFDDWATYRSFQSGKFALKDYDYEKPGASLLVDEQQPGGYAHDQMEMFDFPGDYTEEGEGKRLAKVRLEADQARDQRRSAVGYAPSLLPGFKITRTSETGSSEDIEYLLLRCTHAYGYQTYESDSASPAGAAVYVGTYELMSSERQYRAPLLTRKSIIQGAQTAKVVGQQGEEIDVDNEGRILVQFFWDRKDMASRRVRVAQFWAGKYQGSTYLPRIGDEVVVQYLEGDPDRPLVVGSVYNGDNHFHTTLPDNKTHSGWNSDSSKGHQGYNNFVFDDKAGEEWIKLRAQKDLIVKVLHDETRTVGGDQSEEIDGNLTQSVGGNQTLHVGATGGTYSLTATQEIVLTVGASSLTITAESITLTSPQINFDAMEELNTMATSISTEAADISISAADIAVEAAIEVTGMMEVTDIVWEAAEGLPPVPPV